MSGDYETIVQRILETLRDTTRESIIKLIEEKKKEARGYLTPEGAARIVASELGVKIHYRKKTDEVCISDLISGVNDITLSGRILAVHPVKSFKRRDDTEGKIAKFKMGDASGTATVILWDEKTDYIAAVRSRVGEIIRVNHGYVRKNFYGKPEIHVGSRGEIEFLENNISEEKHPPLERFTTKIGDLNEKMKSVDIIGKVHQISPNYEFQRKDGSLGRVKRVLIGDGTGESTVVLWNEKVEEADAMEIGDYLGIFDGRVKKVDEKIFEVHVERRSFVTLLKKGKEVEHKH